MALPRRALCGAVDIKGWSGRPVPEQIRAQHSLVTVVHEACREAGLPEEIVQSSGDGVLIMPPSDIDETTVLPDLVRGMTTALRQENRMLSDAARIRVRLALTNGIVATGPAGFSGPAVIECFRLLDSPPAKAALVDFPRAELALIVSDYLYQDVIRHGFADLRPEDFSNVQSTLPEKSFTANAWVWVSDRTDGRRAPTTAPAEPEGTRPALPHEVAEARTLAATGHARDALRLLSAFQPADETEVLALLDVRADAYLALGRPEGAVKDLEEILRVRKEPSPTALLRLARAYAQAGDAEMARQTFGYLLDHDPMAFEAHLELGRLERQADRYAVAKDHLTEAARLLEPQGPLAVLIEELLELPLPER
ncbi:tetratricopeptide repeat protein [Actinoallomurus sp. NPDC052308]|uniref:tetratricopeptide repeat protein n=1 Tax=Actinoallomurus sp. NPDC052308 TaxID=3155530 RepID=UPI003440CECD